MNNQQAKYELLKEHHEIRYKYRWLRFFIIIALSTILCIIIFAIWSAIYRQSLNFPPPLTDVPHWLANRAKSLSNYYNSNKNINYNNNSIQSAEFLDSFYNISNTKLIKFKQIDNERIYPSKLGNFIFKSEIDLNKNQYKIVCYYSKNENSLNKLLLSQIDPHLCTHINIGIVSVINNSLHINNEIDNLFKQTKQLKIQNNELKFLIWIGGADNSKGFSSMIKNHSNRKLFIQSIKKILEKYRLDGIDLDWEFPSAYNKERQHFSQLLHEIRREYQREHRTYLLSVAVAAPEGIAYFAYDIREINSYADYVNIMTYDFHFYSKGSPFTGLNAPLYAHRNEHSILATLNINYTVNYWKNHGLDSKKIIIGLPTYGHSFRLVNPYNNGIGSPASGFGKLGQFGFVSYSEICWFKNNNIYVNSIFDVQTCSPYMYAGLEWISYENEESIDCKTKYIKTNQYGGAMIFSLNTDDHNSYCNFNKHTNDNSNNNINNSNKTFPLTRKVRSVLIDT